MPDCYVTRLAWEWFQGGSDTTSKRLQDIVFDLAETYTLDDATLEVVLRETTQRYVARYGLERLLW